MKNPLKLFLFVTTVLSFSILCCTSKTSSNRKISNKAQIIVNKSIKYADPLSLYPKIISIDYDKTTLLYNERGGLEDSTFQHHHYSFKPKLTAFIKWEKEGLSHDIYYKEGVCSKFINDELQSDSLHTAQAYSMMMASVYVMMMPFKLNDPGTKLNFDDRKVYPMIGPADVVSVTYDAENFSNHTNNDLWWYYFDPETSKLLANKVDHKTGISLITNNKEQEVKGIKFHLYRKSYNLNSKGEVERLRGEFFYENIHLELED